VELKEQPSAQTLAHKLGDVPHVSGLLRRIAQLSGTGERVADWLLKVAVERGARHYQRDFDPTLPADLPAICDEEIGVVLCLGQNPYSLDALRVAAQFLSSPRINAARLYRLAEQEPWATLRNQLHPRHVPRTAALDAPRQPHRNHARRPTANRLALPP
jgi:hypothetical protein